jgi:ribosome recycling factor
MPQMTEERRKELVKLVGQMAEKARIAVRGGREEVLKQAKKMEADKEMSEDDLAKFQKHLQDLVDKCNGEIKQIAEDKEKEVMTV